MLCTIGDHQRLRTMVRAEAPFDAESRAEALLSITKVDLTLDLRLDLRLIHFALGSTECSGRGSVA